MKEETQEQPKEIKSNPIDYNALMQKYLIQGLMPNTSALIGMNEYKMQVLKDS